MNQSCYTPSASRVSLPDFNTFLLFNPVSRLNFEYFLHLQLELMFKSSKAYYLRSTHHHRETHFFFANVFFYISGLIFTLLAENLKNLSWYWTFFVNLYAFILTYGKKIVVSDTSLFTHIPNTIKEWMITCCIGSV